MPLSVEEEDKALFRSATDPAAPSSNCDREQTSPIFAVAVRSLSESSDVSEPLSGNAASF